MDNAFDLGNERLIRAIERVEVLNLFCTQSRDRTPLEGSTK